MAEYKTPLDPIPLVPFSDYRECPPPAEFIIEDIVVKRGLTLLVGSAGVGKSTLALNAALSVANEGRFLGKACVGGEVIFVNPELPPDVMARRAWEMCEALGYPTPDKTDDLENKCGNVFFSNLRGNPNPLSQIGEKLKNLCAEKGLYPSLIVFDSLYMLASGDENDAANVTKNLNVIASVAEETGAGVIVTHHTTKGSQSGKSVLDRASGSGAFGRMVDVNAHLGQLDAPLNEKGTAWRLEFGKTRHTPPLSPINLRFDFPCHYIDESGELDSACLSDGAGVRNGGNGPDRERELLRAYDSCLEAGTGYPTVNDMAEALRVSKQTIERWVNESGKFEKFKPDGEKAHRVKRID